MFLKFDYKMDEINEYIAKFLSHSVLVHIYSHPNFSVETFLGLLVTIVNFLLVLEINNMYDNSQTPAKIHIRPNLQASPSKESSVTSVAKVHTRYFQMKENGSLISNYKQRLQKNFSIHSNCGWIVPQEIDEMFMKTLTGSQKSKFTKIDQVLSITPSEYIKRDKQKRQQVAQIRDCIQSLTKMLNSRRNKLSKQSIQKNLEIMQEHLSVLSTSDPIKFNHPETECIDETLYDIIESIVLSSSVENPLPHKNLENYSFNQNQNHKHKLNTLATHSTLRGDLSSTNDSDASVSQDKYDIEKNTSESTEEEICQFPLSGSSSRASMKKHTKQAQQMVMA